MGSRLLIAMCGRNPDGCGTAFRPCIRSERKGLATRYVSTMLCELPEAAIA